MYDAQGDIGQLWFTAEKEKLANYILAMETFRIPVPNVM